MTEERVALVTGASRNIGRAIALALADAGSDIIVHVGRDRAAGEVTADAVRAKGRAARVVEGDLADPAVPGRLVAEAAAFRGRLDILISNAAIRPEAELADLAYADWRRVMAIALDAPFLLAQAAQPWLEESPMAAIVNIGGLTGHTGAAGRAHVITAKAGLAGLTKALAHELSPRGITVNCVAPGLIETARSGAAPAHHGARHTLIGRSGRVEEVAAAVVWLCDPASRYVTGQVMHVNGGAYLP
ncbi:SDR family NAD(P)-dependent oxidoreductase [Falsirhodobacter sp. 20TX0035]|uniref:SDR family NAD(P)-dependent oxidoreductase n=1 Tax=Falsirhodobacter sp. 20TX0035 TaxID=3022019 RepID=UPI0023312492|nr:SDR family oxidoreductase [Falsirhodobacter sp. 20TX0035]MDB6455086.1 SDR family oxidoreductase [Falsirhodobacter sp. 20TX0035]